MIKKWIKKLRGKKTTEPSGSLPDPMLGFKGLSTADLDLIMRFGKASNALGGYVSKSFIELPYGIVRKDLPTLQKKEMHLEYITAILSAQYGQVDLRGVTANEIMSFMLWIRKEQEKIMSIEKRFLSSDPDQEAVAAGIHKLDEFGALATIHGLAQGDILRHPAIEALPYYKVYEILKLEKINREISKAHSQIVNKVKPKTK